MQDTIDKVNDEECVSTSATPDETDKNDPQTQTSVEDPQKSPINESPGVLKLRSWLNKSLRIEMTDKRVLVGVFLCTDRDANVILGACSEYLPEDEGCNEEPRMLGLVMVPGKHIVTVSIDENSTVHSTNESLEDPLTDNTSDENIV